MVPRLHAEQLTHTGAAALAADLHAASADHLDHVTIEDSVAMAAAGVVGVMLPGAGFSMRAGQAPARMLWDAGVTVALATDCNPGTSYVESMQFVIALACLELGLTADEAVAEPSRCDETTSGSSDRAPRQTSRFSTSRHIATSPTAPVPTWCGR